MREVFPGFLVYLVNHYDPVAVICMCVCFFFFFILRKRGKCFFLSRLFSSFVQSFILS